MSYSIISIDHSIKLAITASIKRFEFKRYDVDNDQLVDALLTDLFTDLFPHDPSLVSPDFTPTVQLPVILPTTTTTTTTTTKEKKKPGPKPKVAPIPEQPVEVVSSTPAPAPEKKKPGPKKSKVEQPEEEVVLPTPEPASEKKKPGPKPKPKKVKFTKQHLNAMKEAEVEPEAFTTYINTIDPEAFDANNMFTYLEDFIRSTKKPKDESEEGYIDMQCVDVEFNGKTYFVNPDTRVVYQANDEHVNVKVGIVGALEFADMELPSNV